MFCQGKGDSMGPAEFVQMSECILWTQKLSRAWASCCLLGYHFHSSPLLLHSFFNFRGIFFGGVGDWDILPATKTK